MRRTVFLTAEWRKLIMANYRVEASRLMPYLPPYTELDKWNGDPYVSLVGFAFREVQVRGFSIPFHTRFPEVNLRFYVRRKEAGGWKRGVVFISEIVPLPAISLVANTLFREHYISLPMRQQENKISDQLEIGYLWKYRGRWNNLSVVTGAEPVPLLTGSKEEFITEHFWGYSQAGKNRTVEYEVEHPRWEIYPVKDYSIDCDFKGLYGNGFSELSTRTPESVFMAEGSPIKIYPKRVISAFED